MTATHSLAWVPSHVPAAGRLLLALAGRLRHGFLHLATPDGEVQVGDAASPLPLACGAYTSAKSRSSAAKCERIPPHDEQKLLRRSER